MTCFRTSAWSLALLSTVTWLWPQGVLAAPSVTAVADVSLDADGLLSGRVVNERQLPEPNQPVAVFRGDRYLGTVTTDDQGRFGFPLDRGGVYQVSTAAQAQMVRVWTASTAPPVAQLEICLSTNTEVVRGQPGQMWRRRAVPIVALGLSATALGLAIILPLAINGGDDPVASM